MYIRLHPFSVHVNRFWYVYYKLWMSIYSPCVPICLLFFVFCISIRTVSSNETHYTCLRFSDCSWNIVQGSLTVMIIKDHYIVSVVDLYHFSLCGRFIKWEIDHVHEKLHWILNGFAIWIVFVAALPCLAPLINYLPHIYCTGIRLCNQSLNDTCVWIYTFAYIPTYYTFIYIG